MYRTTHLSRMSAAAETTKKKPTSLKPSTQKNVEEENAWYEPRERRGQYELIFPFSTNSEQLSIEINKYVGKQSQLGTA